MAIDLYSNHVPDNATIEAESLARLNATMPPREREKLSSTALTALHADVDAVEVKEKGDRNLLQAAIQYEHDEARLAKPVLDNADYPNERDEATGKFVRHHALVKDDEERADAKRRKSKASLAATQLVTDRKLHIEVYNANTIHSDWR